MDEGMDKIRQRLVLSIIHFLKKESSNVCTETDRKEALDVAIQCLENAYVLDPNVLEDGEPVDLLALISDDASDVDVSIPVTEEEKMKAEMHKNKGNEYMRQGLYQKAINEYTAAIELHPNNAVLYSNRAAAYSHLEKYHNVIRDCKKAIKMDPNYAKAYSRLGNAYSNLHNHDEARAAFSTAIKLDPTNERYRANLKLAEEKCLAEMEKANPPEHRPIDVSQFINNTNFLHLASQLLNDPGIRNVMSGILNLNNEGGENANIDLLVQMGQQLAQHMNMSNPDLVESLRRHFGADTQGTISNNANTSVTEENQNQESQQSPSDKNGS